MDERPAQRAEASVASRSESDPTNCPPLVSRGAGARRHAATADSQGRSEAEAAAGWPRRERSERRVTLSYNGSGNYPAASIL